MALAWPLIISIIVVSALVLVATVYFFLHFGHPQDKRAAWLPKIIIVATFAMSAYNILLLPLDVANRTISGGLDMVLLIKINYWLVSTWLVFVIPFAIFFYEAEDAEDNTVIKQAYTAGAYSLCTVVVAVGVIAIMYSLLGDARIPVNYMQNGFQSRLATNAEACASISPEGQYVMTCVSEKSFFTLQVTLIVYIISMVSVIGLIFFICFGGIGLVALPMDLIQGFREAEIFITPADYAQKKLLFAARATQLLAEGKTIQEEERVKAKNGKRNRRQRNKFNRFKKEVFILERDWEKVQAAWKLRRHPYWYFVDLIVGIIMALMSVAWFLHIVLFMLTRRYISPFLNNLFIGLTWNGFNLFGSTVYSLFVFYLLAAVVKGNIKFGLRVGLFTIHPMKVKGTMVNSFLFNGAVVLCASVAVVQFASSAFSIYTRLTAVSSVFDVQINNLKGIGYLFRYSVIALLSVMFLTAVYLFTCPSDSDRKKSLDRVNKGDF